MHYVMHEFFSWLSPFRKPSDHSDYHLLKESFFFSRSCVPVSLVRVRLDLCIRSISSNSSTQRLKKKPCNSHLAQ